MFPHARDFQLGNALICPIDRRLVGGAPLLICCECCRLLGRRACSILASRVIHAVADLSSFARALPTFSRMLSLEGSTLRAYAHEDAPDGRLLRRGTREVSPSNRCRAIRAAGCVPSASREKNPRFSTTAWRGLAFKAERGWVPLPTDDRMTAYYSASTRVCPPNHVILN